MRRQSGSALVLGSIAVFMLMAVIFMVYHIGTGTSKKMRMQNAADAAALAGAQVLANSLSTIAWINNGISLTHYNLLLYSRELTTRAMFDAFKDGVGIMRKQEPGFDPDMIDVPFRDYGGPDYHKRLYDQYVGTATSPGLLPRAQQFVKSLARIERAIAMMTPIMVDKQVHRVASENGADRVALFPGFAMFPDPEGHFILEIVREPPPPDELERWIIRESPETATNPFEVEAVPHREEDGGGIQKTVDGRTGWTVTIEQDGGDVDEVEITAPDLPEGQSAPEEGDFMYQIKINKDEDGDGAESSATILHPMTIVGSGGSVKYDKDGTMVITDENGVVTRIKIVDNGMWVNGVFHENQEGTNVGGANINVTNNLSLQVGDMTVYRDRIRVGRVLFWFDPFRIDISFPAGVCQVHLEHTRVNGLSTANADGRWHLTGHSGEDRRGLRDRIRHRMTEIDDGEWEYEWKKDEANLRVDDARFAYRHLMQEVDGEQRLPDWVAYGNEEKLIETFPNVVLDEHNSPEWKARWFNPLTGAIEKFGPNLDRYFLEFRCKYIGATGTHPPGTECKTCGGYKKADGYYYALTNPNNAASRTGGTRGVIEPDDGMELTYIPFVTEAAAKYISPAHRPLMVTEELFKFGITVATWGAADDVDNISGETSFLDDLVGQSPTPDWGYFAVAGARVGFFDNEINDFRYRFDTADDRTNWVNSSGANLYQPLWNAALYPVRLMIRSEDIDTNEGDSGLNFLFRALSWTGWRTNYSGTGNSVGTNLWGMRSPYDNKRFDLSGDELEDVIHH